MPRPRRMRTQRLPSLLFGSILTLAAGCALQQVAFASATPARTPGEITIYRDAKGVPHIFGADSAGVLYGLGYSLSQDRMAQMELGLRAAQGRRSEILGPSFLEGDKVARDRLLSADELTRMYKTLPAEHQAMMQAFVDGINHHITEVEEDPEHELPYQFKQWGVEPHRWTLLDYIGYIASYPHDRGGYERQNQAFLNAMTARHGAKLARLIFDDVVPLSDPDSPTTIPAGEDLAPKQPMPTSGAHPANAPRTTSELLPPPPAPRTEASRCLVIGPSRSASGHVLMMEATADGPESHLYGGGFDTVGFGFAAWGPPVMGHSLQHGWLMTSGQADTTITYAERLNPKNQYQYWFNGKWEVMQRRSETIDVKGAKPVIHEVAWTVHGPVVEWDTARHVAYTERYAERGKELDNWVGMVEMARAKNLAEFEQKGVSRLAWNLGICYGDEDGQIGFWEAGVIPKRPDNADPRLPTPGTGEYEWTQSLSAAEHPHMLNPKQGFIHTWNSKATTWSREGNDARIGKTFRTWLGTQWASSHKDITLLDMRDVNRQIFNAMGAQDRTNTSPAFFAPYIRAAVAGSADAEVKRAADLMLSFNGLYEDLDRDGYYDNPGLTLFRAWLQIAPQVIFGPDTGDWWRKIDADRYLKYQTSLLLRAMQGKSAGLPLRFDYFDGRDRNAVIVQTIRSTIDQLKPQFAGKEMTAWRLPVYWKYFDPARKSPDKPALPGDETGGTARLSAVLNLSPVAVKHHGGEEWVGLMELTPHHPVYYSVVEAGGQDLFIDIHGHGNPHLTDQLVMHAENELKRVELVPSVIEKAAVSTTHLTY
jgi:penicillin G amidase